MRIISGIFKHRILISPDSQRIRPTSDRAKETLFNILNNQIDFSEIVCLDLFCGTGNLGLESLSRNAGKCIFVDTDVSLVTKNIDKLGIYDKSEVIKSDAISYLTKHQDLKVDLIFSDPPYDYKDYKLLTESVINLKSLFVIEHSDKFIADKEFEKFIFMKKKTGTVNFTLFDFKNIL
ncbi:MAG: RsmD family RNA methyltransferase [Ignavibacteria bacterium]|nr:RsmD family RNA methyltransferase [Ignavibacteria bacterium]